MTESNVTPARLKRLAFVGNEATPAEVRAMAAELLALRPSDGVKVKLDGNEIWEWLMGHLEGDVPTVLDDGLLDELAAHINTHFLSPGKE